MNTFRPAPLTRDTGARGFVLVCVLWVLAILTVIAVGFGRRAMLDRRATAFTFDHARALYMAKGAVARGIVELRNKAVVDALYKQQGYTGHNQRWAHPVNLLKEGNCFSASAPQDIAVNFNPEQEQTAAICEFRIRDEQSRISINAADEKLLHEIEGLGLSVVRKLMFRRNGDDSTGDPPQSFQAIEELRSFEGISDEDWFGNDRHPGLKDVLTCWGDGRINVNTAPPEVLACIPDLDENVIDAIVTYRKGPDDELETEDDQAFFTMEEVAAKAGIDAESLAPLQAYCTVDSQYFTIQGVATRRQGKVRAACAATVLIQGPEAQVIKWREESLGL